MAPSLSIEQRIEPEQRNQRLLTEVGLGHILREKLTMFVPECCRGDFWKAVNVACLEYMGTVFGQSCHPCIIETGGTLQIVRKSGPSGSCRRHTHVADIHLFAVILNPFNCFFPREARLKPYLLLFQGSDNSHQLSDGQFERTDVVNVRAGAWVWSERC